MPVIIICTILSFSCLCLFVAWYLIASVSHPRDTGILTLSDEQVRVILGSKGRAHVNSQRRNAEAMHTVSMN